MIKTAIVRTPSDPLTLDHLTLHNIRFVFLEFSQTRQALWNTVLLGVLAATGGTFLALTVSYVTQRGLVTGHRFLGFLATAPIAIPGIVLGVGLFLSYTRPPLVLYGTLWILLLAFLTIELPAGYQQLQAAFRGLHPELEDAGRIFGATRLGVLWRITEPLLRTSVIATWCFVFIGVIRELSATIMLTTAANQGRLGHHLRPQRKRRPRCDLSLGDHTPDDHFPRSRHRNPAAECSADRRSVWFENLRRPDRNHWVG